MLKFSVISLVDYIERKLFEMGRAKGSPIVIQKFIRSRLGLLLELLNKIEPLRCYFPKKIVVVKIL